jgi:hypothetical protein
MPCGWQYDRRSGLIYFPCNEGKESFEKAAGIEDCCGVSGENSQKMLKIAVFSRF